MPRPEHEAIVAMQTAAPNAIGTDIDALRANMEAMTAGLALVEGTMREEEEGLIHVWQAFPGVPESDAAVARIGAYLQARCA